MATNDGVPDIGPQPDPSIPQQDMLSDKRPVSDQAAQDPSFPEEPDPGQEAADISSELENVQDDTEQSIPEPDTAPESDPQPSDEHEMPSIEAPDLSESGEIGFEGFPADDLRDAVEGEAGLPGVDAVDAGGRDMEAMGRDLEAFHAGGGDFGGMGPEEAGGGRSGDDGARDLMDADYRNRDASSNMLTDHARRLDELTERLERNRL